MTQPPFSGNDFFDQIDSVARNLTGNAFRLKKNDPTAPQKFTEFVAQSEQEFSATQPQAAPQSFRDFEQGGFQVNPAGDRRAAILAQQPSSGESLFDQSIGRGLGMLGRGALGLGRTHLEALEEISPVTDVGGALFAKARPYIPGVQETEFDRQFAEASARESVEGTNPFARTFNARAFRKALPSASDIPIINDPRGASNPVLGLGRALSPSLGSTMPGVNDPLWELNLAELGAAVADPLNLVPGLGTPSLVTKPLSAGGRVVTGAGKKALSAGEEAAAAVGRTGVGNVLDPVPPQTVAGRAAGGAGDVVPRGQIEFVENFPLNETARTSMDAEVDDVAQQLLSNSGIRQIQVDPPYTFDMSQQAGVSANGVVRVNPTVANVRQSVLHEAGHVLWERASTAEQAQLRALVADNLALLRENSPGYVKQFESGDDVEAVAQIFAQIHELPEQARRDLLGFQPTGRSFDDVFPAVEHVEEASSIAPKTGSVDVIPVRSWDEIKSKSYGQITDKDDIASTVKLHGDRMVVVKDINGGRSVLPASQAARLLDDPMGSGFVSQVFLPSGDIPLGPAIPQTQLSYLPEFKQALERATAELPAAPAQQALTPPTTPATGTAAAARGAGKPKFAFEGEEDLVLLHGTDAEFTGIPNAGKDGRIYFSDSTIEGRGASSYYGDTVKKFNLSEDARMMDRDEVLTPDQVKNIIAGAEDGMRRLGLPESQITSYKRQLNNSVDENGSAIAGELSDRLDGVDRGINPKMGEPGYDFRGGQSKSDIANAGLSREFDFISPSGNRPHEYSVLNKDVIIDSGLRQTNLEPVGIRKGPDPDFNQFGEPYPTTPATRQADAVARGVGDNGRTQLGFKHDNPVVELERSGNADPRELEFTRREVIGNRYTVTGRYDNIDVPVEALKGLPGASGEEALTGVKLEQALRSRAKIVKSIRERGFDPSNRPLIGIEPDGTVNVIEGNQRIAAATEAGLESIPVEVRYFGGSEMLPDVFDPANIPGSRLSTPTTPATGTAAARQVTPQQRAIIDDVGTGALPADDVAVDALDVSKITNEQKVTARQVHIANEIPIDEDLVANSAARTNEVKLKATVVITKIEEFLDVAGNLTKNTQDEIAQQRRIGAATGRKLASTATDPVARSRKFLQGFSGRTTDRQIFDPLIDPKTRLDKGLPLSLDDISPTEAARITGITSEDIGVLYHLIESKYPIGSRVELTGADTMRGLTKVLLGELPQPAEVKLLRKVFGDSVIKKLMAKRSGKAGEILFDLLFLVPKTLRSSFDWSAPLRQLVVYTVNPRRVKQTAPMLKRMFHVGFTKGDPQKLASQLNDELVNPAVNKHAERLLDPKAKNQISLHDVAEDSVLQFTDKEEVYASNLSAMLPSLGKDVQSIFGRKVPKPIRYGISATLLPVRIAGKGIRRSELMYATAINQTRMRIAGAVLDNWDEAARAAKATGGENPVLQGSIDELINGVNVITGRGNLPGFLNTPAGSKALAAIFWAPKLAVSRFQAPLIGARGLVEAGASGVAKLTKADPDSLISRVGNSPGARARKEMAKDLVTYVVTGMTILAALEKFGIAEVETDPRSSDFGKGKIGNTRIDFWGGFQQPARYVWQIASGTQKRLSGKNKGELVRLGAFNATVAQEEKTAQRTNKPTAPPNRLDLMWRFLQSKVAPGTPSIIVNELRGQTFIGDTLNEQAPLFGQDTGPSMSVREREALQQLMPLFAIDVIEVMEEQGVLRGIGFSALSASGVGVQSFGEEGTGRFDDDESRRIGGDPAFDSWAEWSKRLDD